MFNIKISNISTNMKNTLQFLSWSAGVGIAMGCQTIGISSSNQGVDYELRGDGYFHNLKPYVDAMLEHGCGVIAGLPLSGVCRSSCEMVFAVEDFMVERIQLCRMNSQSMFPVLENCFKDAINGTFYVLKEVRHQHYQKNLEQQEQEELQYNTQLTAAVTYLAGSVGLFAAGYVGLKLYRNYNRLPNFAERLEKIDPDYLDEIDRDFICPISYGIFNDPVFGNDDHIYDRDFLTRWVNEGGTVCPLNPAIQIDLNTIRPNIELRNEIEAYVCGRERQHARIATI